MGADEWDGPVTTRFIQGDTDGAQLVNVADAGYLLKPLFAPGSQELGCSDTADVNDDKTIHIADLILLLNGLFFGATRGDSPPSSASIF